MTRLYLALMVAVPPAAAGEHVFTVTIDGRPAGEVTIAYDPRPDRTTAVTVRVQYQVDRPVPISFDYRGTETWRDGRLVRLDGLGTDGRTKGGIQLEAATNAYALKAGVKQVTVRGAVWPTLGGPPPEPDDRPLVVDVITGDVWQAKVETVGPEALTIADKRLRTTRYRVAAANQRWDLWYDESGRLVKRVWTRAGRTVGFELKEVRPDGVRRPSSR